LTGVELRFSDQHLPVPEPAQVNLDWDLKNETQKKLWKLTEILKFNWIHGWHL
jgi:hypothetical protein